MEYLPKAALTVMQKTEVMSNADGADWAWNCLQMIATQVEVWSGQCSKWFWYETHSVGKELVFSFVMGVVWIYFTFILYTVLAVKI